MSDANSVEKIIDVNSSEYYINRELSHLQFNIRVLEQALDETHPLLDRLFFLCIFSKNLDEFYEVRVANLTRQLAFAREQAGADGMHPQQVLNAIHTLCSATVERQYAILNDTLIPALQRENIHFLRRADWTDDQRAWVRAFFDDSIQPLISPIRLDPSHPFPRPVNKSLNFIVALEGKDALGREPRLPIIPTPRSLPRIIRVPDHLTQGGDHFIFLSSMIHEYADELFPGMPVKSC